MQDSNAVAAAIDGDCIQKIRKTFPKNTIIAYFNINSIGNKFVDAKHGLLQTFSI